MDLLLVTIEKTGTGFTNTVLQMSDNIDFFSLNNIRDEHDLSNVLESNCEHLLLQGHIGFPVISHSILDASLFNGTIITTFRHPYYILRSFYVRAPEEITLLACISKIELWLRMVNKYDNARIVYTDIMTKISADDRLILMADKIPLMLNKRQISVIREWEIRSAYKFCGEGRLYDKNKAHEVEFTNKDSQLILDVIDNSGIMDRIASVSNYDLSPYQTMDLAFYDVWR